MNDAGRLFAEQGLAIERPYDDVLFLEDYVYEAGIQEEYSIVANYARDPERKERGHAACNWLALNRQIPLGTRELAWSNLFFYIQPASATFPSFTSRPIGFAAPDGYRCLNPSVLGWEDRILLVQRTANYTVAAEGLKYETPNNV